MTCGCTPKPGMFSHPPFRVVGLSLFVLTSLLLPATLFGAEVADKSDYEQRVAKAQLDKHPEKHKELAAWCKRKYPEKHQFHLDAWNRHQFGVSEASLSPNPVAMELFRMSELAAKMGLADKAREYRGKWGLAQYPVHAAKLKPGDTIMMKRLLDWAIKEKIEFIPPCQELAQTLIDSEPDYAPARLALKHLKLSKGWMSMDDAMAAIDLQHAPDRLELHRALAATRPPKKSTDFQPDPTREMEKSSDGHYRTATKNGGQPYFLVTRNYDRGKPCALVIGLHGGGDGGLSASIGSAATEAKAWAHFPNEGSWVVLCPTVRNHIANSWWDQENLEHTFDAIEETLERFNIDRTRIYVTGTSMGANGTALWMYVFPELAAAYCTRAGAYWNNTSRIRDLLAKPVLVIHGEKDKETRNKSRDEFIRKTEELGGLVTHASYPQQDHFIGWELVFSNMVPFFLKHSNPIEPDFGLLREVFRDRHRKHPQPGK